MENKYLGRDDAPIGAETWNLLDNVMIAVAKSTLAGRKILAVDGPFGFGLKGIPLNDCDLSEGITAGGFLSVNAISSPFSLGKRDLAAFERDHLPVSLNAAALAVMDCAAKEDSIVFSGIPGCSAGLLTVEGSGSQTLSKWDKVGNAATQIIEAVTKLDDAGFHGPYIMALAPGQYNLLLRRYPQGEGTELDHISSFVTGGVVKAPALKKGGVLLASDHAVASIVIGQDMKIGYNGPVGDSLTFYVSESLALLINIPQAICVLK
jgi:uncharacterized linocin/CFP29 family protein